MARANSSAVVGLLITGSLLATLVGPALGHSYKHGDIAIGQAGAPFLFALLMERFGASALFLSTTLGLAGLAALLALNPATTAERA